MIGKTIGKYRIVEQIGRGGMGTVYKAIDETLDRTVAIKMINADLLTPENLQRFRSEAITLAKLRHPRIAAIHELTREGADLLMVMEYVPGETCEKLLARTGALPVPLAVVLCDQVLDALEHAHAAGIIHRDLKPSNVMVTASGDVSIMDFGIARVVGSEHLTMDGYMMGTPAYMAPEQVRGEEVDGRVDLYSTAVMLYRLLTQHLPFRADTPVALIHSQLVNPPTPPRQFRADLPEWIDRILERGLAKAPADRFQTAAEFRLALGHGLTGTTTPLARPFFPSDNAETVGPMPTPTGLRGMPPTAVVTPTDLRRVAPTAFAIPQTASQPLAGADAATPFAVPQTASQPAGGADAATPFAVPQTASQPSGRADAATPFAVPQTTSQPAGGVDGATPLAVPQTASQPAGRADAATRRTPYRIGAVALLVLLMVGVAVLAYRTLRRPLVVPAPAVATTPSQETPLSSAAASPDSAVPSVEPTLPPPPAASSDNAVSSVESTTPPPPGASPNSAVPRVEPTTPPRTPAVAVTAQSSARANTPTTAKPSASPARSNLTPSSPPASSNPTPSGPPAGSNPSPSDTPPAAPPEAPTVAPEAVEVTQSFGNVRTLVPQGTKSEELNALLSFEHGNVIVRSRDTGSVLKTMPYREIEARTYARAKRPRWKEANGVAPIPDSLGGSGSFLGTTKHWLTLQSKTDFLILRLEDQNIRAVLSTIETRTGAKPEQPDLKPAP